MPDSCYRHNLHGRGVVWSTVTGSIVLHYSYVWPSRGAEDGPEASNILGKCFATEIHPETFNELFLSYPRVTEARGLCKFFLRNGNAGVNLKPWVFSLSKREQWWHCWSRIFGNVISLRNFTRWVGLAVSLRVLTDCHTEFPSVLHSVLSEEAYMPLLENQKGLFLWQDSPLSAPPALTSQLHSALPSGLWKPCFLWTLPFEVKFLNFFILWESFFQTLTLPSSKLWKKFKGGGGGETIESNILLTYVSSWLNGLLGFHHLVLWLLKWERQVGLWASTSWYLVMYHACNYLTTCRKHVALVGSMVTGPSEQYTWQRGINKDGPFRAWPSETCLLISIHGVIWVPPRNCESVGLGGALPWILTLVILGDYIETIFRSQFETSSILLFSNLAAI